MATRNIKNAKTGEVTHETFPDPIPPTPPTPAETLAEKQDEYDEFINSPNVTALVESFIDAVNAGGAIDVNALKANGRSKIT